MDRFFVHLTSNLQHATSISTAKGTICILKVLSKAAHEAGIPFYRANSHVWLTTEIPAEFLAGHFEVPDELAVPVQDVLC